MPQLLVLFSYPKVVLVAQHEQGRYTPCGFWLIVFVPKKSIKNLVHGPRAGRTLGPGMKTTPGTTTHSGGKLAADRAAASGNEQSERIAPTKQQPPVAYPDLEEQLPDDCYTTYDPPVYGKRPPVKGEQSRSDDIP
ncbi:MAG: hypothetical protein AAGB22_00745 [Bacteroidota bacterium]